MKLTGYESQLIYNSLSNISNKQDIVKLKLTTGEREIVKHALRNIQSNELATGPTDSVQEKVKKLLGKLQSNLPEHPGEKIKRNATIPPEGKIKKTAKKTANKILNFLNLRTSSKKLFNQIKDTSQKIGNLKGSEKEINKNINKLKEMDFKLDYLSKVESRIEKEIQFNEKLYFLNGLLLAGSEKQFVSEIKSELARLKKEGNNRIVEHEVKYIELSGEYESQKSEMQSLLEGFYDVFTDESHSNVKKFCDSISRNLPKAILQIEKKIREYTSDFRSKMPGTIEYRGVSLLSGIGNIFSRYSESWKSDKKECEKKTIAYRKLLPKISGEFNLLKKERDRIDSELKKLTGNSGEKESKSPEEDLRWVKAAAQRDIYTKYPEIQAFVII